MFFIYYTEYVLYRFRTLMARDMLAKLPRLVTAWVYCLIGAVAILMAELYLWYMRRRRRFESYVWHSVLLLLVSSMLIRLVRVTSVRS